MSRRGETLARTCLLVQRDFYPQLPAADIEEALTGTRVRLTAHEGELTTRTGQTALVATFVWVAQLGCEIFLHCPRTSLAGDQPPLVGRELRAGLLALSRELATPAQADDGRHVETAIALGASRARGTADTEWRLSGDSFSTLLSTEKCQAPRWTGTEPFGALLGGIAAAAEVFRAVLRRLGEARGLDAPAEWLAAGEDRCRQRGSHHEQCSVQSAPPERRGCRYPGG